MVANTYTSAIQNSAWLIVTPKRVSGPDSPHRIGVNATTDTIELMHPKSSVVVVPTVGVLVPWPVQVVKESMACNLPIVSVPAGDVPEVIGGTDGCYVCSQDPEDVADKLEMALKFGKRTDGRERISHLEIGHIAREIVALYEGLIEEKRRSGLRRGRLQRTESRRGREESMHS